MRLEFWGRSGQGYMSGSRQPGDRMRSPCRQGREETHGLSPRATQPSGNREMRGNQKKMEKSSQGAMQGKQGRGEDCKLREEGVSGRGSGQLCLMMTTGEVG